MPALGRSGDHDTDARRRGRWAPYALLSPGVLWLLLFFLVPLWALLQMSLSTRESRFDFDPSFTWDWSNYTDVLSTYGAQFGRSFRYAAVATVLCILIAYPLAYFIAFRAGRWRNLLLGLVVVPFFTSFLIRTIAWQTVFFDDGPLLGLIDALRLMGPLESLGLVENGGLLGTSTAVIGGLTYNFVPFMVLPIYVSLEKVDPKLIEAARDLYANGWTAFRKVVLPLSLPGVFAGSLLTFIPAAGDFINARFLGGPTNTMIGTVVQDRYLVQLDYPAAAAISFILMAIITIAVLVYARLLGTDDLM
jgi:spermidine/putrescine transport system permease protein